MRPSTAPRRLDPRYFERSLRFPITLIYLSIFMIVLVQNIYTNFGFSSFTPLHWAFLGGGFTVLILLEAAEGLFYPKTPYFWLAVLLTGIRIIALYTITISEPTGITSSLMGYILFTMCFYFNPLSVLPILLIIVYTFYLDFGNEILSEQFEIGYLYEIFSFVMFYLFAIIIRWDDRVRRKNQALVNQLERYATNSISLGKEEERNRISRDLHDSLGHQLVAVNIQLQKAVAYRDIDAGESQNAILNAQQSTNEAIKELRQTIKDLREFGVDTQPENELENIVNKVRENGLQLEYTCSGSQSGFPELTLLTLKQVIQEGLTNIQKHAQAEHAVLRINFQRRYIRVEIEDDGCGFLPRKANKDDHYGLQGMQERIQMVGGRFKITSQPKKGTKLFIQLPKDIYG